MHDDKGRWEAVALCFLSLIWVEKFKLSQGKVKEATLINELNS